MHYGGIWGATPQNVAELASSADAKICRKIEIGSDDWLGKSGDRRATESLSALGRALSALRSSR